MELLANLWYAWAVLFVVSFVNRKFTIHEVRTGAVRVGVIRWYFSQGFFWGSVVISALSIVLNVIKFTKS